MAARPKAPPLEHILKSLGDPVRLSIIRQLLACGAEKACGSFDYDVAKATFSHHISVLEDAGIVGARQDGTRRMISLRTDEINERYPGLIDLIRTAP